MANPWDDETEIDTVKENNFDLERPEDVNPFENVVKDIKNGKFSKDATLSFAIEQIEKILLDYIANKQEDELERFFPVWISKSKKGMQYLRANLGKVKLVGFRNASRQKETHPHYFFYL